MDNRLRWWPVKRGGVVQRLSLQTCLTTLILLVLIPTLCAVAMTIWRAGQSYREASTSQLLETANVVARSVESELQVRSHMLAGYTASRSAGVDSIGTNWPFEGHLSSIRLRKGPTGFRAEPEPTSGAPADVAIRAASTGKMAVSNIFTAHLGDGKPLPEIAIAVPHGPEGADREIPILVAKPADLVQTLMREGVFEGGMVLAVTDGTGHVIARSRDADAFIGKPVPDWKTLRALNRRSGTFEARTIEGPKVMFAFQTINGTPGWTAVVGEPLTVFNNRWRQPILVLLAASVATILIAFLLAMLLARRMLGPIKHLAQQARAVAEGKALDQTMSTEAPPSFVAEFETLRQSLESADAETRRSHKALHDSYEALRQAEKLSRIGSWTLDLATGRFTTSDMLYELNGADPNGPALRVEDLQKLLTPDSHRRINAAIAKCAETGEPYGLEVEHLRPDGSSFAAYIRGQATRDDTGRIVKLSGTVQDISERQEERQRLATLADNLPSGAIYRVEQQTDGSLATTYISAGIIRLIGVSAVEIIEDPAAFLNAVHPEDKAGYLAAMERSHLEDIPFDHEFRMHTTDGRLIWMHCRSAPRRQSDGRVIWDGIARDITGDRQVAEALRQAKETAESAERSKSDFLATMSHEIRTPMNTVVGMTRLMLKTDLAPKQRNYLGKIDISAKALLGIINDILDFSKIEAGGLELEDSVFTIESLLESVSAVMAMPAEEKGLELAYAVGAGVPRRIHGDPLRLGQVLTNLVSNAVKFTDTGEVVITVEPVQAEGRVPDRVSMLQFSVRDTGVGLSADQISGLFRPFSQASSDTFRKYGGTGLGLAICKQLVEKMGGRIRVESTPGHGSVFIFTIATESVEDETASDVSVRQSVNLTGTRILVVDDNALNREVASDFLLAVGVEVDTANDGLEALDKLELHHFDAVLMDMHMPRMDGLSAVREIRRQDRWRTLPVIALTAQARIEDQNASFQAGMTAHLTKPINEVALYQTLMNVLDVASDRRDNQANVEAPTGAFRISQSLDDRASGFSLPAALRRFGGTTVRVEKLLTGFLRDFSDAPQQLDNHLRTQKMASIALLAHTMKGSAGYFDAHNFCTAAGRLERAIQENDIKAIETTAREFRGRLERLLEDIEHGLAELKDGREFQET